MIFPKLSLKQLILGVCAFAIYFAFASLAFRSNSIRDSPVGLGVLVAGLCIPIVFCIHAFVYFVIRNLAWIGNMGLNRRGSRSNAGVPLSGINANGLGSNLATNAQPDTGPTAEQDNSGQIDFEKPGEP